MPRPMRVGHEQEDDLRARAGGCHGQDGAQGRPDAGCPADREGCPEREPADDPAAPGPWCAPAEAFERLPRAPQPVEAKHPHEVEAEHDEDDAADLAQQRQVVPQRASHDVDGRPQDREDDAETEDEGERVRHRPPRAAA